MRCVIIAFFLTFASFAQTESISIIQYTAGFAEEVSLDNFRDYNIETLFMSKSKDAFNKNNIKYLPTIILYNDGEEEIRIESGITLKLPEDWKNTLIEHIDSLLEQRF